jgi:rhodanese-related sulfurtransferase
MQSEGQLSGNYLVINGITVLGVHETLQLTTRGAVLVDLREAYLWGYKKFDVPLVIYLPHAELSMLLSKLPHDSVLILADSSGNRVREDAIILKENGFQRFAVLSGGMVEWERNGGPVIIDKGEELTGSCICQMRKSKST